MQVQVVKKPLKYGGRRYGIGQRIEMTGAHARLLIAIGLVCIPRPPRPDIPASPSTPVTLVETPEASVETETEESKKAQDSRPESPTNADRPRRQYRRRDMRPENRDPQAED